MVHHIRHCRLRRCSPYGIRHRYADVNRHCQRLQRFCHNCKHVCGCLYARYGHLPALVVFLFRDGWTTDNLHCQLHTVRCLCCTVSCVDQHLHVDCHANFLWRSRGLGASCWGWNDCRHMGSQRAWTGIGDLLPRASLRTAFLAYYRRCSCPGSWVAKYTMVSCNLWRRHHTLHHLCAP